MAAHHVTCITLLGCRLSDARRCQVTWKEGLGGDGDGSPRGADGRPETAAARRSRPAAVAAVTAAIITATVAVTVIVTVAVRPGRPNGFVGLRRAIRTRNAGAGGVGVTAVIVTIAVRLSRLDGTDGLSHAARTWSIGSVSIGVSGGKSDGPRRLTPPRRG